MDDFDGNRLKKWRKKSCISQKELGALIGRSQSYIGDIEAGRSDLSRDFLRRLLERTNVNAGFLLTGLGPMEVPDTETSATVNTEVSPRLNDHDHLRMAIEAIEEGLDAVGRTASPDVKAKMISAAYELFEQEGAKATAQIIRLVKTA